MLQKLKVELPPQPENIAPSVDGYVKCPACGGEYKALQESGLCQDCSLAAEKAQRKRAQHRMFIEACLGARGLHEFTFDNYKQSGHNLDAYIACAGFNPSAHNLYLYGTCGSGKTHLAGAAWRKRVDDDLPCEWLRHPELSRLFRKKEADEEQALLKKFAAFDVLVIDDLGVGRSTEFANQILYEILDMRINNYKNGLILTSNLSLEEFAVKVGDDRLPSRIAGMCKVVKIAGEDHRLNSH